MKGALDLERDDLPYPLAANATGGTRARDGAVADRGPHRLRRPGPASAAESIPQAFSLVLRQPSSRVSARPTKSASACVADQPMIADHMLVSGRARTFGDWLMLEKRARCLRLLAGFALGRLIRSPTTCSPFHSGAGVLALWYGGAKRRGNSFSCNEMPPPRRSKSLPRGTCRGPSHVRTVQPQATADCACGLR